MRAAHEYAEMAEAELDATAESRDDAEGTKYHLLRAQVYATLAVAAVGGH